MKKAKMRRTPEVEARMKEARKAQIKIRMEEKKNNPGAKAWRGKRNRELRVTGAGGRHGRTMTFFNAATRRLAWEDYKRVSVATICRHALSTPYTYYKRFPSRSAFEYGLVLVAFKEMTRSFNRAMDPESWKKATPQAIVHRLVDRVIDSTMTVPAIGVTQLAIRIAMSKPKGAEPYFEFRAAVIDRAVELLSPKLEIPNAKKSVRNAIQMLLATATDEAWRHGIPFKTARKRELAGIYDNLAFRCLGLPPGRRDTKESGAVESPEAEFPEHLQASRRDTKGFIGFRHPQTGFPEHLQAFYGITKRYLWIYEKLVNSSKKPEFKLDYPIEPEDTKILETRMRMIKPEKPKKPRKRVYRML